MRSPIIAFSLMAAAAVSPTLVSAAPGTTPITHTRNTEVQNVRLEHARQLPGVPSLGMLTAQPSKPASDDADSHRRKTAKKNDSTPSMDEPDKLDSSDIAEKEIEKYDPEYADEIPGDGAGGTPIHKATAAKAKSTAAPSQDFDASAPRAGDATSTAS